MFAIDCWFLVLKDKSDLLRIIESVTVKQEEYNDASEAAKYVKLINSKVSSSRTLLVDAMALLQGMVKMCHLKQRYLRKVLNMPRCIKGID